MTVSGTSVTPPVVSRRDCGGTRSRNRVTRSTHSGGPWTADSHASARARALPRSDVLSDVRQVVRRSTSWWPSTARVTPRRTCGAAGRRNRSIQAEASPGPRRCSPACGPAGRVGQRGRTSPPGRPRRRRAARGPRSSASWCEISRRVVPQVRAVVSAAAESTVSRQIDRPVVARPPVGPAGNATRPARAADGRRPRARPPALPLSRWRVGQQRATVSGHDLVRRSRA